MKIVPRNFRAYAIPAAILAVGFAVLPVSGESIARGWLYGFVLVSMAPIGCLTLLLVHGITGGRWGEDLAPCLVPTARAMPMLFLAFLPILAFRHLIYPWPDPDVPELVTRYYLFPAFFDTRTLLAIAVWTFMVWRRAWATPLAAGLGLTAHLVLMTFIPADWVLTLEPGTTSAAFGMSFGIEQIFAALALAAVLTPQGDDPRANRDLAGMMLSALLGTVYFVYVQFVIIWYGNIPEKVRWYVVRSATAGWVTIAIAAFLLAAAIPFLSVLSRLVRQSPAALRVVGFSVLTGIALHIVWLTAPSLGTAMLLPAVLAALSIALVIAYASLQLVERDGHGDA
jgi:multisubunit Na+/H+ antiporter MnhF subunit